jgi:hypothetical protein
MQHARLQTSRHATGPALWPERIKLVVLLLLGCATLAHAEQATELSDDFLEYLGNMENSEDNWTDFAAVPMSEVAPSSSSTPRDAKPAPARINDNPMESSPHSDAHPASAPAAAPKANK